MSPKLPIGWKLVALSLIVFVASSTGGYYTASAFVDSESGTGNIQAAADFGPENTSVPTSPAAGTTITNRSADSNASSRSANTSASNRSANEMNATTVSPPGTSSTPEGPTNNSTSTDGATNETPTVPGVDDSRQVADRNSTPPIGSTPIEGSERLNNTPSEEDADERDNLSEEAAGGNSTEPP